MGILPNGEMKLKCPSLAAGCLALALTGCERAATGEPLPIYDRPQVALLVVDLQKELLGPGVGRPWRRAKSLPCW